MKELCDALRTLLTRENLTNAHLLCGVSGGADSVALLRVLCLLRPEAGFRVTAVHIQHNLRGASSEEDERFVRALCREWLVPLRVEALSLEGDIHAPGMETHARNARREVFARLMTQEKAHALLLAHHRDDQTETVLLHLLRGSGTAGLCGMREVTPFAGGWLLRPFLGFPKQRLMEALGDLPHREDESNAEAITPRNALRLTLLPQLEVLFPGAGEHIARTALRMQADEERLSEEADAAFAHCAYCAPPLCLLLAEEVRALAPAIRRRVLRLAYERVTAPDAPDERSLSWADTLALESLVMNPGNASVNLPCGLKADVCGSAVVIAPQSEAVPAAEEVPVPVDACAEIGLMRITGRIASPGTPIPHSPESVILPQGVLARRPVLRLPFPGDTIRPLGAPGSKPLRRFLTDRKIAPPLRTRLPVLACGHEVLWVPALAASEALRLTSVPEDAVELRAEFSPVLRKILIKE